FFSSRRRHTRFSRDWSSDVCSSDLPLLLVVIIVLIQQRPRRRLRQPSRLWTRPSRQQIRQPKKRKLLPRKPLKQRRSQPTKRPIERKSDVEGKSVESGDRRAIDA